ncbi:hypothetical protein HDU77_000160 [Chytriomyces hyalinus]|nr:hypothetical protein HDU77_000160 [Chytriomyces hyalinus]
MSSCQSAFARFAAVKQDAFGRGGSAAAFDGTYVCEQQFMDALGAYQNACGKDQVRTLTGDYSDTQGLQSFCLQKKGIMLAIPEDPVPPPSPVQTTDQPVQPTVQPPVQPPVQSPIQTEQPVQPVQPGQPVQSVDPSVQVNPGQPSQGAQPQTLQPTNAAGSAAVPSAGAASSATAGNGFRFGGSPAAPTSAVPAGGVGSAAGDGSNSTGLYAGIGVVAVIAVLAVAAFVTTQQRRRRKQAAIDRLRQMPNPYTQQPYVMQGYTNSSPALVPPMLNVPSVVGGIRTSGSHYSSGKTPFNAPSSGAGDDRSSTWNVFTAPIPAPALDEKSSMMNAAYAARSTPTISSSRQRDSLLSDGSNVQRFNTVASHAVSADRSSVSLPPVPTSSDPNQWTVAEVEAWARGLPHFGDKLGNIMLEYQINGRVLMGLDRNAMKDELGLVFGEVSQLEADIAQLRGQLPVQEEGLPPGYDA